MSEEDAAVDRILRESRMALPPEQETSAEPEVPRSTETESSEAPPEQVTAPGLPVESSPDRTDPFLTIQEDPSTKGFKARLLRFKATLASGFESLAQKARSGFRKKTNGAEPDDTSPTAGRKLPPALAKAGAATSAFLTAIGAKLRPALTRIRAKLADPEFQARFKTNLSRLLPKNARSQLPAKLDRAAVAEWLSTLGPKLAQLVQGGGSGGKPGNAATYATAVAILLCAFFLADLVSLLLERYIPEPPAPKMARTATPQKRARTLDEYGVIMARNLFNSQGLIPGESGPAQPTDQGGPAVRTTLPFNLIGTIILRDELRSIATIEDKSASMVYPVRVEDEVPSKIRVLQIEPRKVTFLNLSNGRREFVDLPEEKLTTPRITVGGASGSAPSGGGVESASPTEFKIQRNEVDKALTDLNQVLTQARCVPNFENGQPSGFKCFQIVPGSIYDKLGLKNNDILCGLNGQPINDPGKAFELMSELKTSSHLELCVKRDGRQMTFSYDIR